MNNSESSNVCLDCGTFFKHLFGQKCGKCVAVEEGKTSNGTVCFECGRLFPRLEKNHACGFCQQKGLDLTSRTTEVSGMSNPTSTSASIDAGSIQSSGSRNNGLVSLVRNTVSTAPAPNPRAEIPDLRPYVTPADIAIPANDRMEAESYNRLLAIKHNYQQGLQQAAASTLQRNKVPLLKEHTGKSSQQNMNVSIILLSFPMKRRNEIREIIRTQQTFSLDESWQKVNETFWPVVRREVNCIYGITLAGPEITLGSAMRKQISRFVDQWTISTLGNLWSHIISDRSNSYITQQEKQKRMPNLSCVAIITLTTEQAQEFEDLQKAARRKKKVPTHEGEHDDEEQITQPLTSINIQNYSTQLPKTVTVIVDRVDIKLGLDRIPTPMDVEKTIKLVVGLEPQASGSTKHMYRTMLGASQTETKVFAAMCFYNIGNASRIVTLEENKKHLENELTQHVIATDIGQQFQERAKMLGVSIYEYTFSESWLATIKEGPRSGWTYLMSPMLHGEAVKFSGTVVAGANNSFAGQTMDAFAHFSLEMTGGSLVLIDIQGIFAEKFVNGFRDLPILTLFDLMTHTHDGNSCLGDNGPDGIKQFQQQHSCNRLCSKLRLTPFGKADSLRAQKHRRDSSDCEEPPYPSVRRSSCLHKRQRLGSPDENHNSQNSSYDLAATCGLVTFSVELDQWGDMNEDGIEAIDAERKLCTLNLDIEAGQLFNQNRFKWWLGELIHEDSEARVFLIDMHNPSGAFDLRRELCRFHDLNLLCKQFQELSVDDSTKTAELLSDYEIAWVTDKAGSQGWITASLSDAVSEIKVFSYDAKKNPLIESTLEALSHFSYDISEGHRVHMNWSYIVPDSRNTKARIVAAETHDDGVKDSHKSSYIGDLGVDGLALFKRHHKCNEICLALGLNSLEEYFDSTPVE